MFQTQENPWKSITLKMSIWNNTNVVLLYHCNNIVGVTRVHWRIYILRKIRLCVVDLEGQFRTTLQAKDINLLIWKFRSITLIFFLIFVGVVKSSAFCTLLLLFQRVKSTKNCNLKQKCDSNISTLLVSWKVPYSLKPFECKVDH